MLRPKRQSQDFRVLTGLRPRTPLLFNAFQQLLQMPRSLARQFGVTAHLYGRHYSAACILTAPAITVFEPKSQPCNLSQLDIVLQLWVVIELREKSSIDFVHSFIRFVTFLSGAVDDVSRIPRDLLTLAWIRIVYGKRGRNTMTKC